jgi:hypothetical protein
MRLDHYSVRRDELSSSAVVPTRAEAVERYRATVADVPDVPQLAADIVTAISHEVRNWTRRPARCRRRPTRDRS